MEEHELGREGFGSEEEYRLHCLRHSAAHVLAQAVMSLYPEAKLAIGPPIQDGFYYDIDVASPNTEGPDTVDSKDLADLRCEDIYVLAQQC